MDAMASDAVGAASSGKKAPKKKILPTVGPIGWTPDLNKTKPTKRSRASLPVLPSSAAPPSPPSAQPPKKKRKKTDTPQEKPSEPVWPSLDSFANLTPQEILARFSNPTPKAKLKATKHTRSDKLEALQPTPDPSLSFISDSSLPKLDPASEEEILSIRESRLKSKTDHLKPTCQTSITPTLKGFGAAGDKPVISLSLIDELGRTKDEGMESEQTVGTPSEPLSGSTSATNTESTVCDSPMLVDEPTERVVMILPNRSLEETLDIFNSSSPHLGPSKLTDEEIVVLVQHGKVAAYALEKVLKDFTRAVRIRRALIC